MPHGGDDAPRQEFLLQTLQAVAAATNGPDPYLTGHSARVAEYCDGIARAMTLPKADRLLLSIAAWFHDIGNLSTPAYILRKPSALAEDEMEEIRVHPLKGAMVFAGAPALAEIARAIRHHHERFDGTGYPDGLRGEAIPLFSRIILVSETFDAMTHDRPYRRALSGPEATQRLRDSAGSQLDPAVVEHFLAALPADGRA